MLELLEVDTGANERPGEATIWPLLKSLVMPNNEKKSLSDAGLSRGASSFIMIHGYSAEGLPAEPTASPSAN